MPIARRSRRLLAVEMGTGRCAPMFVVGAVESGAQPFECRRPGSRRLRSREIGGLVDAALAYVLRHFRVGIDRTSPIYFSWRTAHRRWTVTRFHARSAGTTRRYS